MTLTEDDIELLDVVYDDLLHIQREASPECNDHQLRRISVQLRNLLIENGLLKAWRLLALEPKQPIIIAPKLCTEDMDYNAIAVAGGAQVNAGSSLIGNTMFMPGKAISSDEEAQAMFKKFKDGIEYLFPLHEYKDSASIFIKGKTAKRREIVAYVAHKKGGAHLDTSRRKSEEIYKLLDTAVDTIMLGGNIDSSGEVKGSKSPIYMEMMSIAQNVVKSPDIIRLMEECKKVLERSKTA